LASMSFPAQQSTVVTPAESLPAAIKRSGIDRLQLTAGAMLRAQSPGVAGTQPLADGGSLGASQAGARLTYNFTRQIAASFRTASDVGRRGGEVAAGMRVQPVAGIPLWIDAERRQRVGRFGGGRNAFAVFFEAGVYDRPMPLHFLLDSYLQGGVVGVRNRDKFIDGALTLTRPVYKRFSAGFGVWGGAQPGVYRVDVGPRAMPAPAPVPQSHSQEISNPPPNPPPGREGMEGGWPPLLFAASLPHGRCKSTSQSQGSR